MIDNNALDELNLLRKLVIIANRWSENDFDTEHSLAKAWVELNAEWLKYHCRSCGSIGGWASSFATQHGIY